ncbi:MAG: archaellin/type IV pilin N-terminal domain-containing protein [Nanoarchaeota archaeon]
MNKKGISPLIATVLLIGFTIVLAALVFRWSGQFFQGTTEETNQEIEEVMVLTGVDIDILNVRAIDPSTGCDGLELLIENNVEVPIDKFVVRVTTSQETQSGESTQGLDSFSSYWIAPNISCVGAIQKIEVFPRVLVNGRILIPTDPAAVYVGEIEEINNTQPPIPTTQCRLLNEGSCYYESCSNYGLECVSETDGICNINGLRCCSGTCNYQGTEKTISWNSDSILLVDGEKTFPIGMFFINVSYGQPYPYSESFRKLGNAGFNLLIMQNEEKISDYLEWPSVCQADQCEYLMGEAEKNDLMVIAGINHFYNIMPSCTSQAQSCVTNKSAFLGYSNMDEPIWSYTFALPYIEDALIDIKQNDPNHIIWTNFAPAHHTDNIITYINDIKTWDNQTDIFSTSIHPRWDGGGWIGWTPCSGTGEYCILDDPNITIFGNFVALYKNVIIEDDRPFWMILDHSYDILFNNTGVTGINFDQKRFITYDTIVNGATGIIYWAWNFDERLDPSIDYWDDTKEIVSELNYLEGALVNTTLPLLVNTNLNIKKMVKYNEGKLYIFAVNRRETIDSNEVFTLPAGYSNVNVLFEGRTLPLVSDEFIDTFDEYAVHIYEIN